MTQSGIRSRSTPGGNGANCNEIRFEDRRGAEELRLQAERDQVPTHAQGSGQWVGHESHLIVRQDMLAQFDADHHQTVSGDQNVELGGSHSFSVGQDWQGRVGLRMAVDARARRSTSRLAAGWCSRPVPSSRLKVGGSYVEIGGRGDHRRAGGQAQPGGGGSPASGSGAHPEKAQDATLGRRR